MTSSTQAINPALSSLPPQSPPQGMPPSLPPDPSAGAQPSDAELEIALRQQLAQAQAQQQNPFQKALKKSMDWLKTHWPIVIATTLAVVGGGVAIAKMKGTGNNNRQLTNNGGFLNNWFGKKLPLSAYEDKVSHAVEALKQDSQVGGKIQALQLTMNSLKEYAAQHLGQLNPANPDHVNAYGNIDTFSRGLDSFTDQAQRKLQILYDKASRGFPNTRAENACYNELWTIAQELKGVLQNSGSNVSAYLNELGPHHFSPLTPPVQNNNLPPVNNNNPQPTPILPAPTPAPRQRRSQNRNSPPPAPTGFWGRIGNFINKVSGPPVNSGLSH